jgi:hypothetical protein
MGAAAEKDTWAQIRLTMILNGAMQRFNVLAATL